MTTKQPGPTVLCECIGQALQDITDVWFGPMDVANCLARGLRGGGRLADEKPVSTMFALGKSGLKVAPGHLAAVAVALNALAETDRVTEAIVTVALMEVMRLAAAGVIVVTVSISGELSFETAGSLIQLIKRRVGAGLAQKQAQAA